MELIPIFGSVPLYERFRRLYDLAANKVITVRNMFLLGVENGQGAWQLRRRLWVWEEDLVEECRDLLLTVSLQESETDRWLWLPDEIRGYTVRGVYDMLASQEQHQVHQNMELIWHK